MDNKFERWDMSKHSPEQRCISSNKNGPCPYMKANGSEYCIRHGANKGIQAKAAETQRNYRLQRWQKRVGQFADNTNIKSLREEVGILRMILEEMLHQCKDSMDLLLYSSRMSDLVMKIDKLVTSCDRLENRMGLLLSKDSILHLASMYVQIINTYVQDADTIEKISTEMQLVTEEVGNPILEPH